MTESAKENWKDTKNKLHQTLYDYFDITEGVVIEKMHRVEKWSKSKQEACTIVAKLM